MARSMIGIGSGLVLGLGLLQSALAGPDAFTVYNVRQQSLGGTPACAPAAGNGVADDRGPIQCALDWAATHGGGIVYLPQGTYALGNSLLVASRVTLRGEGAATVLAVVPGSEITGHGLIALNSGPPVTHAAVRDLAIDGAGGAPRLFAGVALTNGASFNTVANLLIENVTSEGIGLYKHTLALGNNHNTISGNVLRNNGRGSTDGQLIVWNGQHNRIVGNVFERTDAPLRQAVNWGILLLVNHPDDVVRHTLIQGNRVINTGWGGIVLMTQCPATCQTNVAFNEVVDNVVRSQYGTGILVDAPASFNKIAGNNVAENARDGIHVRSRGNTVTGNMVTDNGFLSGPYYVGIRLAGSGATDNVVSGNVVTNVLGGAQQRGIQEDPDGPDFNLITGNSLRGSVQTPGAIRSGAATILRHNPPDEDGESEPEPPAGLHPRR